MTLEGLARALSELAAAHPNTTIADAWTTAEDARAGRLPFKLCLTVRKTDGRAEDLEVPLGP